MTWDERWLWLGDSVLLAVLWANLAWFFHKPLAGTAGEYAARLIGWRFSHWLFQIVRLFYYVGLPFSALLWGNDAVVGRLLGLPVGQDAGTSSTYQPLDWAQDLAWAAALGAGAWSLLALGWWAYRRSLAATSKGREQIQGATASGWILFREAAYHEIHWAFYRNASILELARHPGDTYWGVWAGLALVLLEAVLNPAWRRGLTDPQRAPAQLLRATLAVISSTLFLLTENLLLALALHFSVTWGLAALARSSSPTISRARQRPV